MVRNIQNNRPFSLRKRKPINRQGAALVEFAVCLPVLMLLILGSIEASSALFVKQALVTSAYEAAREAIRTDGTTANANSLAQNVLDGRRIRDSNIRFTPASVESAPRGSKIIVEVSAPYASNSPFIGNVIQNRTNTVRTVMIKE